MSRRSFTRGRLRFGFEGREELGRHHLCRCLDHTLAHAGNRTAYLYLTAVLDQGRFALFFKFEISCAFQKSRRAFAVNNNAIVFRGAQVCKAHIAIEDAFDRAGVPLDVRERAFDDRHRLMERS